LRARLPPCPYTTLFRSLEAELAGVERHLHGFRVAGVVFVGGVSILAAAVADLGVNHAVDLTQQIFHAPEAAAGDDGGFGLLSHRSEEHTSELQSREKLV